MQNINTVSRPKLDVIFNGVLCFALSQIFCEIVQKNEWNYHGNCACIQPAFSAYRLYSTLFLHYSEESAKYFGLEGTLRFYIYFVFENDFFLWKDIGININVDTCM